MTPCTYREARLEDIDQLTIIRTAVKENVLSNPDLVTYKDYVAYLTKRGKGWVCEVGNIVVGFTIADLQNHNIWALFILPEFEGFGIGQKLQQLLLTWYFNQTQTTLWLSTAPGSRAARFYLRSGWQETGRQPNGEIRFEMPFSTWQTIKPV